MTNNIIFVIINELIRVAMNKIHHQVLVVISLFLIGCSTNEPLVLDYCAMLERDQTTPDKNETDTLLRRQILDQRRQSFVENFELLLAETKQNGFPFLDQETQQSDSCKYWAVTATLIHMGQAHPHKIFTREVIDLFANEMNEGRVTSGTLFPAFSVSFVTKEFCDTLENKINLALDNWKIDRDKLRTPRFKKCE